MLVNGVFKKTESRRFQEIQKVLTNLLLAVGKTCSEEDLNFVTLLFEHHTEGIPPYETISRDGQLSFGFYYCYLKLTMYEADPEIFHQLLKLDQKIGWTNPAHVEIMVFLCKGIKIIEDEKVMDKAKHFLYLNIIFNSELVKMVPL